MFNSNKILKCLLIMVFAGLTAMAATPVPVRTVPVPTREHGYANFAESAVILSAADLESFISRVAPGRDGSWNNLEAFTAAIATAGIDFSREALVLIRHTEGSGSIQVSFVKPELQGRRLVCRIQRSMPSAGPGGGFIGTADMVYYCFALAVLKQDVSEVEVQTGGRSSVLKIWLAME